MLKRARRGERGGRSGRQVGPDGPYIIAALFCAMILEEPENVLSAMRIADRITFGLAEDAPPDFAEQFWEHGGLFQTHILIIMKSGEVTGERTVTVTIQNPAGERTPLMEHTVVFPGGNMGVNLRGELALQLKHAGIYWFDVEVEGVRMTRMPLEVIMPPREPDGSSASSQRH